MFRVVFSGFFCVVVCLMFVVACAPKQKAVLRVGTGAEYPPFSYQEGGNFAGVDMDITRRIAEKLDMEIQFVKYDFNAMFSALLSNKIDIAASALTITAERQKTMDFSPPYYTVNQVLITRNDSGISIKKLEDARNYRVGSLNNTTGHIYLDEYLIDRDLMPKDNLKLYPTNIDAINALMAGELDLVIIDDSAAIGYEKQIPIRIAYTIETHEQYGLAMQKGKVLNEKISKALEEMIRDGEVKEILARNL